MVDFSHLLAVYTHSKSYSCNEAADVAIIKGKVLNNVLFHSSWSACMIHLHYSVLRLLATIEQIIS